MTEPSGSAASFDRWTPVLTIHWVAAAILWLFMTHFPQRLSERMYRHPYGLRRFSLVEDFSGFPVIENSGLGSIGQFPERW